MSSNVRVRVDRREPAASGTTLPRLADVESNLSDLQTHVGVTGSTVPTSIEYRLADVQAVAAGAAGDIAAHEVAADPHAQYLRNAELPSALIGGQSVSLPSISIGWDSNTYPIAPSYSMGFGGEMRGGIGMTPEQLFDLFSTARSAPANTYYVDIATGSDSNSGTIGARFKSIKKALETGNASGSPYAVIVKPGAYDRANGVTGTSAVAPTQDMALLAEDGLVECGSWDSFSAPSLDVTYTNCYTIAQSTVLRVLDLAARKSDGTYRELMNVASAAICDKRPGTWASVAGTIYVNRADGAAVTTSNTRLIRQAVQLQMGNTSQVCVFIGGTTELGQWDFYGGDTVGGFRQVATSPSGSGKCTVVKNAAFRCVGGFGQLGTRCVTADSYPGLVAFFNVHAAASATDGFNFRNTNGASPPPHVLTVNCTAEDIGYPGATSCNGWTLHDNVIGIDICGRYMSGAGGTVHNINSSKSALIGTTVGGDVGDTHNGGTIKPTAVRAAHTAEIQMYASPVLQQAGFHLHAVDTSVIVTDADVTRMRVAGHVTQRA